jgi:RNA polymerase sigma-70 factor (ECF subfamily)
LKRLRSSVNRFKLFYNSHRDRLFAYLLKMTGDYNLAADLMQESFTRYLERYKDRESSTSLLFTIGRNLIIDHSRRQAGGVPYEDARNSSGVDQERTLMVREEYRRVLTAMQKLPETDRDILSLVVSSGLPYSEIAKIAGISESNLKVKIHRLRLKLRKVLEAGDP